MKITFFEEKKENIQLFCFEANIQILYSFRFNLSTSNFINNAFYSLMSFDEIIFHQVALK